MDSCASKAPRSNGHHLDNKIKLHTLNYLSPKESFNKENISRLSNLERNKYRLEGKASHPNLVANLDRSSKVITPGLKAYNRIPTPVNNCPISINVVSPKYTEIDLLKENYRSSSRNSMNAKSIQNLTEDDDRSDNISGQGESNKNYLHANISNRDDSYKSRSKNRHLIAKENNTTGTALFEAKSPEKINIYTRLLSTMKPATPKLRDLASQKQTYNSPKNTFQRTSIDLIALTNEARKTYVNGPTINGRPERNQDSTKTKGLIPEYDSHKVLQRDRNREQSKKAENKSEQVLKETHSNAEVSSRHDRRDRFLVTKKLTIDIHEAVEASMRRSTKSIKGTVKESTKDSRSRSNPKVYDNLSIPKRDFDKTCIISKSTAFDPTSYKNYINSAQEGKITIKASTPKGFNAQALEIKKLFASSKNLSGMLSQVKNLENVQNKDIKKCEPNTTAYQNLLKTGNQTAIERSKLSANNDSKRRLTCLNKTNGREDMYECERKKSDDIEIRKEEIKLEKRNSNNLKDFITQVNSGANVPLRTDLGGKVLSENDLKKQYANSAKNATSHKIVLNSQINTSNRFNQNHHVPKIAPITQVGKATSSIPNSKRRDGRALVLKTEQDEDDSYSEFKSELVVVEDDTPKESIYYMTSIERYIRGVDIDDEYFEKIYKEHFLQTYQAVNFCKYLKDVSAAELEKKRVCLPKRESHKDKKTLIFDLDETLIHCNESVSMPCDVVLPIQFPHGDIIEAGINIRPYTMECLEELSELYEIIVFTASHSCYANVALDYLDPENKYIHHRLFREHCVTTEEGLYIKDLRILANRDLKDMVIVDNAVYSFGYQLENGIPIVPFYYNKNDTELQSLTKFLKELYHQLDVREHNKKTFRLHHYVDIESQEELMHKVFSKDEESNCFKNVHKEKICCN